MKRLLTLLALVVTATALRAADAWSTDFAAATAEAKKNNRPLLLDFTGSDWCGWCIKMKKESLDKKDFLTWAKDNVVLVEVDFPNSKPQTAELKKSNDALQKKYKVDGYPTFVLIDADGKELGRVEGYTAGGPQAFIAKLNGFIKAAKK